MNKYTDFILMGCKSYFLFIILADGIFDNLSNKEIINIIWITFFNLKKSGIENKSEIVSNICNKIINYSIENGSNDNLSCIFIGFNNFFNNKESLNKILNKIEIQTCNEMIA